jgi:hypothetical protein
VLSIELAVITGLLIVQMTIMIFAQFKLTQIATTRLVMEVKNLDQAMVEIVEKLMNGDLLSNMEPINPFQALLAQFLQKKIDDMPRDLAVVSNVGPEKNELGQFVKKGTQ